MKLVGKAIPKTYLGAFQKLLREPRNESAHSMETWNRLKKNRCMRSS